jgi:hypothetical protein
MVARSAPGTGAGAASASAPGGAPGAAGGPPGGRDGLGGELAGHVGLEVGDLAAELLGGLLDRQLDPADLDREAAGPHGPAQVGDHAGDVRDHPDEEHGHQQRPEQAPDGLDDPGRGHPPATSSLLVLGCANVPTGGRILIAPAAAVKGVRGAHA